MNQSITDILTEIEQRRIAKDALCDLCRATGLYEGEVCSDCLGQKVMLFRNEYDVLLLASDPILDSDVII